MTRRLVVMLLVVAFAFAGSYAMGDLLTVKHAHGEVNLKGIIQTYYAEYEDDEIADTFDLRRVWLCASGSVYEKVEFQMLALLNDDPKLCDAWIKLKYIPNVDLTFGQMYKPATYESLTSTAQLPFILYALPTQYMRGNNVSNRDIGAKASFHLEKDDFTMFLLEAGVYNGTGINTNDENDQKDWVGKVCIQPIKGIQFFGNYTYGTYGHKVAEVNVNDPFWQDPLYGHEDFQQYSGGLAIDYMGLDLAGEWMGMHTDYIHNALGIADEAWDMYGWYVHLGYKIDTGYDYFHTVEPIVRYEYLDPDTNKDCINDLGRIVTYGLNVWIDKHYAKLQLNYVWNINDSAPHHQVADNVFIAQLQGYF